ncbi:MAG: YkgJ family cysteine cluster protein [Burkholderiaceae bacterium]|nr:YkgJ family cysteine cluster protein [Burkholderiaceae bacterium]
MTDVTSPIARPDGAPVSSAPSAEDNPCLSCGACCAQFRVSFYFGELDTQPGGWVPVALTSKVNDFRAAMKGTESGGGRCTALRGEVGKPGISCSIYPLRSSTCREFSAWEEDGSPNPDCQRLRVARGLLPLEPKPQTAAAA